MKVILETNSFTMDTREARLTRLNLIKDNIEKFASELSLEMNLLEWILSAHKNFSTQLEEQNIIFQDKNELFKKSDESESDLYYRYIAIKELLLSKTKKSNSLILDLKMDKPFPANKLKRFEITKATLEIAKKNIKQFDKLSIPFILFENLENLYDIAEKDYNNALKLKNKSADKTKEVNQLFDNDSVKLRELYNWVVAFWSKKDVKLVELGFSLPISVSKSSKTPNKINGLKMDNNYVAWIKDSSSENYQLAWRSNDDSQDYKEYYYGTENKIKIPSSGEFKIRGWNSHGFGEWSEILKL